MKYQQPYGLADPNAPYVDRNTAGATSGSRVPARAIEHPQREIMAVITGAGLTPSATDLTQLKQAIAQMIAAATGGGATEDFVLMSAARVRLPIFPEVITSDGSFNLTAPATGTIRIPAGIEIVHRGIFSLTTAQQDFVTSSGKIYHLRWSPSSGFSLKDLANPAYNPSALAESAAAFDSSYDDMVTHRIVTNGSNIATITALKNKSLLRAFGAELQENTNYQEDALPNSMTAPDGAIVNLNFARTPFGYLTGMTDVTVQQGTSGLSQEINVVVQVLSRYQIKAIYQRTTDPSSAYIGWAASA